MKIIRQDNKKIELDDLSVGDVFIYVDTIFMKIEPIEVIDKDYEKHEVYNAICLKDGTLYSIRKNDVLKTDYEFIIK